MMLFNATLPEPLLNQSILDEDYPALGNLRELRIVYPLDLPADFIQQAALKSQPGTLETLNFEFSYEFSMDWDTLSLLFDNEWFKGVRNLGLVDVDFEDFHGELLANTFPNLERLSINISEDLTDEFVRGLVDTPGSKLRQLHFYDDGDLNSNLISAAEERGIELHYFDCGTFNDGVIMM